MNLRCMYCQTMFGISREAMLIGLQAMQAGGLSHFDFHCPKCRRANRVERAKLERANPNWQEAVKTLTIETAGAVREPASVKKEEKSDSSEEKAPSAEKKPAPKAKAAASARQSAQKGKTK